MTTPDTFAPPERASSPLPIGRSWHPASWIGGIVVVLVAALVISSLITNRNFEWPTVFHWFVSSQILFGLLQTLGLTGISMLIGLVLGGLIGIMRMSRNPVVVSVAWFYIWLFRGTPVFVQLLFWGAISALYPRLVLGIPYGPHWYSVSMNAVITPYLAAILGLGLNEAAYMAEIVRAGLKSVDAGQREAAAALGMGRARALRRVVLPQAMPVLIPPTANELIGLLKSSSMVSVLAFPDLLYSAQLIYSVNYQTIPLLITASLWYLIVTSVLSVGQYFLERHYGRSFSRRVSRRTINVVAEGHAA